MQQMARIFFSMDVSCKDFAFAVAKAMTCGTIVRSLIENHAPYLRMVDIFKNFHMAIAELRKAVTNFKAFIRNRPRSGVLSRLKPYPTRYC